jgi:integrase/predicted DNA-binding transcriptional regulator AlpA
MGGEEILRCEDLARILGCTAKAVRYRVKCGQLPPPFRLGKALAWLRDPVFEWLRDRSRSAGPAQMKINLRPYAHDQTRWHVDIRIMHPTTHKEIRRRLVAPAGLSEARARSWGEHQVPKILGEVLGAVNDAPRDKEAPHPKNAPHQLPAPPQLRLVPAPAPAMTIAELFCQRFEPEYVRLQKPATRVSYDAVFRNYIGPGLGALQLSALDENQLSAFRASLRHRLGASTCNFVLAKLARLLRFAKRMRLIDSVPEIDKFACARARPKAVLSDAQISALLAAAAEISSATELMLLLALDAGLRCSEICALEWSDIDFAEGSMTIQHNHYRGQKQTPKGTIGKIALTSALRRALEQHRRHEPIGPLVLYRRSFWTRGEWAPYSPNTVRYALNEAQARAGLPATGPHLLRHTALTRLAKLGASVYVVQSVARHTRLQTTQTYIHTQQAGLAREAADLLDRAASGNLGKGREKLAKKRQK